MYTVATGLKWVNVSVERCKCLPPIRVLQQTAPALKNSRESEKFYPPTRNYFQGKFEGEGKFFLPNFGGNPPRVFKILGKVKVPVKVPRRKRGYVVVRQVLTANIQSFTMI